MDSLTTSVQRPHRLLNILEMSLPKASLFGFFRKRRRNNHPAANPIRCNQRIGFPAHWFNEGGARVVKKKRRRSEEAVSNGDNIGGLKAPPASEAG